MSNRLVLVLVNIIYVEYVLRLQVTKTVVIYRKNVLCAIHQDKDFPNVCMDMVISIRWTPDNTLNQNPRDTWGAEKHPAHLWFSSSVHDWHSGTKHHSALIHTHQSHHHYVLNSAEWVASVVSHLQLEENHERHVKTGNNCYHPGSTASAQKPTRFENSWAGTEGGSFLPFSSLLSCVIGRLTANTAADAHRMEHTGDAKCQLGTTSSQGREHFQPSNNLKAPEL